MDEFSRYDEDRRKFAERRREIENEKAHHDLLSFAKSKVKTTMIGAISAFEQKIQEVEDQVTDTEYNLLIEIFNSVRAKVLDQGNSQIRHLDGELQKYEVSRKRYHYVFPFRERDQ